MTARRLPTLTLLPAACIVALLVLSLVTGHGLVRQAAATTVDVTGSVDDEIFIDAAGCSAASVNIGDLVPGTDGWKTAQDQSSQTCSIDFGTTNHLSGTTLTMLEDPAVAPGSALKCVAGGCPTGSSIADFEDASSEPPAGTAAFGTQLLSSAGAASPVWSLAPGVHDLQDAGDAACTTPGIGTGTCAFTWGAIAAATTPPGAYQAQANLVVLAN
ncbi:MAG: hypothetical protein JWM98_2813 [Thermoleophilia bacterium]|nr:hypothetical protein [Thermoleophilia bacterium]